MTRHVHPLGGHALAVTYHTGVSLIPRDKEITGWGLEIPDGPNIAVHWNKDARQWHISILTEEMPRSQHSAHGEPYLCVDLNDSPIYDREPPTPDPSELRHELACLHADLWRAVPGLRREGELVRALAEATGLSPDEIRRNADADAEALSDGS